MHALGSINEKKCELTHKDAALPKMYEYKTYLKIVHKIVLHFPFKYLNSNEESTMQNRKVKSAWENSCVWAACRMCTILQVQTDT